MQKPFIEFKNVSVGYVHPIVSNINLSIYPGEFIGIIGPNGVGKTTFLKTTLKTLKPLQGEISYNADLSLRFGYVPQRQMVDEFFPLTVQEIVLMGRYRDLGIFQSPKAEDRKKVIQSLESVGMAHLADASYRGLSGGQKQRTLLARALASNPTILVLDEPTTDMDLAGERTTMELVRSLAHQQNLTVLLVSHLLHVVINHATRLAFVRENRIDLLSTKEALTPENLSALYGIPVHVGEVAGKKFVL